MAAYSSIPNSEVDIDKPVKSSTGKKFRDNPLAVTQGDPTALLAGEGVAIDYDFGAGSQTSIITDETDSKKALAPDGAGGAFWSDSIAGWTLLERKEIAVATNLVTFAGLNGDVEEVYKIIGRIRKVVVGSTTLDLVPNGTLLFGASKIIENAVVFNIANRMRMLRQTSAVGGTFWLSFECLIHARLTVQAVLHARTFTGKAMETDGVNAPLQVADFAGNWNQAVNITSLDVLASLAGSIDVGSTFELFKLAQ